MSETILVVEDHKETAEMVKAILEDADMTVYCRATMAGAMAFLDSAAPSLVILDRRLPDGDGLDICRRIRGDDRMSATPIIALTGQDELADKKEGFSAGVDQYLTKPIMMDEIVMWVKALLQRVSLDKSGGVVFSLRELKMDAGAMLTWYRGVPVENLTRREFKLLYALARSSPRVLSRREIIEKVWDTAAVDNLVDTHMFNLKRKIPPALAALINSVPGKGFRYFDGE